MILQQNPELVKTGGFETVGRALYPQTKIGFQIPLVSGKLYHGLDKEDIQTVEDYYGHTFTSPEGIQFFSEMNFFLPDHVSSLNIENPADLLTYKLAVHLGLIAKTKDETKSPMCNAIFFVYDSETENKEKAKFNRTKAKCTGFINTWFEDEPEYLVYIAKYLFDSYTAWTPENALNKIMEFMDQNTALNKNIQTVHNAVTETEERVKFIVDIKEAISRSFIRKNAKGNYYNPLSNTEYGKTFESVVSFLEQNPDEMGEGLKTDSHYSIRKQLS